MAPPAAPFHVTPAAGAAIGGGVVATALAVTAVHKMMRKKTGATAAQSQGLEAFFTDEGVANNWPVMRRYAEVGPATCCQPPHTMSSNSRSEGSKCV